MTARKTPMIFTLEEIAEHTRKYCRESKKSIITAEDIVWSFPGRDEYRRSDVPYEWIIVKREISSFMHSDEMLEDWQQDSPINGHKHGPKRWTRRTHSIEAWERMLPRSGNRTRKAKHPLVRFNRETIQEEVKA